MSEINDNDEVMDVQPTKKYSAKSAPIQRQKEKDFASSMGGLDKLLNWGEIVDKFDIDLFDFKDPEVLRQPIYLDELDIEESQVNEIIDLLNSVKDTYTFSIDTEKNIINPGANSENDKDAMKDHQVIFSAFNQVGLSVAPTETANVESEANDDEFSYDEADDEKPWEKYDGWNKEWAEEIGLMDLLNNVKKLQYEIEQARRGSYALKDSSGSEINALAEYLYGIKEDLDNVLNEIDRYANESTNVNLSEVDELETEMMSDAGKDAFRKALQAIADGKDVESSLNTKVTVTIKDILSLDPDVQEVIDLAKNKHVEHDTMTNLKKMIDSLEDFLSHNK